MIVLLEGHKLLPIKQRKGKKYCKFHNVFRHWTNNCIHFMDLIQKAISNGRLKFEEKPVTVDTNPFIPQANYDELVQILMLNVVPRDNVQHVSILMVDVEQEIDEQKFFDSNDSLDTLLEEFKRENTKVYPNVGDCLVEFLIGKKNVGKEVRLCPRCSTMFDKTTTKSLEKSESIKRAYEDAARRKLNKGKQKIIYVC